MCERFSDYLTGLQFQIEADHKPVAPLLSKNLNNLLVRVQHFQLQLMKFEYMVSYVPGKELVIAGILS